MRTERKIAKRKTKGAGHKGPRTYRGKKVIDATGPFSFTVTASDVKRGKAKDPEQCAGALCIKRTYPGHPVAVHMHRDATFVEFPDKVVRHKTPHPLRDQLLRFDVARKFDPGNYKLAKVSSAQIASRGRQHSPPDRTRGAANSPRARGKAVSHDLGRNAFRFTSDNSDFRM